MADRETELDPDAALVEAQVEERSSPESPVPEVEEDVVGEKEISNVYEATNSIEDQREEGNGMSLRSFIHYFLPADTVIQALIEKPSNDEKARSSASPLTVQTDFRPSSEDPVESSTPAPGPISALPKSDDTQAHDEVHDHDAMEVDPLASPQLTTAAPTEPTKVRRTMADYRQRKKKEREEAEAAAAAKAALASPVTPSAGVVSTETTGNRSIADGDGTEREHDQERGDEAPRTPSTQVVDPVISTAPAIGAARSSPSMESLTKLITSVKSFAPFQSFKASSSTSPPVPEPVKSNGDPLIPGLKMASPEILGKGLPPLKAPSATSTVSSNIVKDQRASSSPRLTLRSTSTPQRSLEPERAPTPPGEEDGEITSSHWPSPAATARRLSVSQPRQQSQPQQQGDYTTPYTPNPRPAAFANANSTRFSAVQAQREEMPPKAPRAVSARRSLSPAPPTGPKAMLTRWSQAQPQAGGKPGEPIHVNINVSGSQGRGSSLTPIPNSPDVGAGTTPPPSAAPTGLMARMNAGLGLGSSAATASARHPPPSGPRALRGSAGPPSSTPVLGSVGSGVGVGVGSGTVSVGTGGPNGSALSPTTSTSSFRRGSIINERERERDRSRDHERDRDRDRVHDYDRERERVRARDRELDRKVGRGEYDRDRHSPPPPLPPRGRSMGRPRGWVRGGRR